MENVFIGEWPEFAKRAIDKHFKGWVIIRETRNDDDFAGRGLFRAVFGPTTLTASSIEELGALADALPRDVNGTIVPSRTIEDTSFPKQYDTDPDRWATSRAYESNRNRAKLLKSLGR